MLSLGSGGARLHPVQAGHAQQPDVAGAYRRYLLGLLIAVLMGELPCAGAAVAKTFIFVPLAISFVGAAVIWRNIFAGGGIEPLVTVNGATPSYRIGLLSALLAHGANITTLYNLKFWGNIFLKWILVRVQRIAIHFFSRPSRRAAGYDRGCHHRRRESVPDVFRVKRPDLLHRRRCVDDAGDSRSEGVRHFTCCRNDDDKLPLATMMENARNNWSIGGDNVDVPAIAIMLML